MIRHAAYGRTRGSIASIGGVMAPRGPLAVALLLLLPALLAAQQRPERGRMLIGGMVGASTGWQSGAFPIYFAPGCGTFDGGVTRSAWAEGRLALPKLFGAWGLGFSLGWENQVSHFTATDVEDYVMLDPATLAPVYIPQAFRYDAITPMLRGGVTAGVRLFDWLDIAAGPWFGYRFQPFAAQTENLLRPNPVPGRKSSMAMDSVAIFSSTFTPTKLAFGPQLSVGGDLALRGSLVIRPEIAISYDLLSPYTVPATSDGSSSPLHTLALRFGVGMLFDITPAPRDDEPQIADRSDSLPRGAAASVTAATAAPSTPSADQPPARSAPLTASIDLFGTDEQDRRLSAVTIHVFRTIRRARAPLVTSFTFERNSASLSPIYPQLTRAQAGSFRPDSLAGLDPRQISLASLNVLGWRLRENPSARVTLRASTAKGEPSWLAYARMETLRSYLEEVWGVAKGRFDLQPSTAGARASRTEQPADARSVTIASDYPGLTDQIVVTRQEQSFDPPLIRLDPQYASGAGIKNWSIRLSHDGATLARYSSAGGDNEESNINWKMPDERIGIQSYLEAEMIVEDSLGATLIRQARTPMAFDRNIRVVDAMLLPDGRERTIYTLYAPTADANGRRFRSSIDEIAMGRSSGDRVMVVSARKGSGGNDGHDQVDRTVAAIESALDAYRKHRGVTVTRGGGPEEALLPGEDLIAAGYHVGEVAVIVEEN